MHPFVSRSLFIPTFAWNYLLGRVLKRRRWWDFVDPHVILGAMPLKRDVQTMRLQGVRAVINMCKEYPGPKGLYAQNQIEQLWLPTIDFNPPSLEDVARGVEFLQQHVSRNETVYVHCKAGRARSATIVICWLVRYRNMTLEAAQAHLLAARPHVNPKLHERAVVREYLGLPKVTNPIA